MPRRFVSRNSGTGGLSGAVNVYASLTTDAQGAAAGDVRVPADIGKLEKALVCIGASAETATDSGGIFTLRLSGAGLVAGSQEVVVGGLTSIAQGTPATGIFNSERVVEVDLDLDVVRGNDINIALAYNGVDMGTPQAGVTLVFK